MVVENSAADGELISVASCTWSRAKLRSKLDDDEKNVILSFYISSAIEQTVQIYDSHSFEQQLTPNAERPIPGFLFKSVKAAVDLKIIVPVILPKEMVVTEVLMLWHR